MAQTPPPLGSTPDGADWCLKALHPSDPQTEVRGIPDKSAVPSVFMNYQSTFVVGNPDPAGVATWDMLGQLTPHPINFLTIGRANGPLNATQASYLNSQLLGATHAEKYTNWLGMVERWRLAYMSVSIYQDAPALSNQGTLVAAQHVVKPLKYPAFWIQNNGQGGPTRMVTAADVTSLQPADIPNFTTLQSMPNAYFNRSVEGAYISLKLTKTCQKWHSTTDAITHTDDLEDPFVGPGINGATLRGREIPSTPGTTTWPFIGTPRRFIDLVAPGVQNGTTTSNYCNDVWATFAARNLGPTTSFSFFVRAGFEVQVQPGTALTSHQRLSPKYDRTALDNYFAISRELKDAYPVEYNDKGVILSTIAKIANAVSPFLGMVPGVGGILSPIASGVGIAANALDKLTDKSGRAELDKANKRLASSEYGNLTSMAQKEALLAQRLAAETKMLSQARLNQAKAMIAGAGATGAAARQARQVRAQRRRKRLQRVK